jgi:hypothetical protein
MQFLYHPDTVLTAADIEILTVGSLSVLSLPGVEGAAVRARTWYREFRELVLPGERE